MTDTWHLLLTPPARGAWNMAVDEAMLASIGRGDSLPTLRLYAWSPACLSLGVAQPYADVDFARLRTRGWDVVRRITGGRAILNTRSSVPQTIPSWLARCSNRTTELPAPC
jgi:lipoate-protein ligase A